MLDEASDLSIHLSTPWLLTDFPQPMWEKEKTGIERNGEKP